MTNSTLNTYRTLEDIRQRKDELRRQLDRDTEHISRLWDSIFVKRSESTRGEFISSLISNSALAIDAFLMVRKLRRDYSSIASLFSRKKRKKK
ncbi:MAG: hypothetical protein IJ570_03575 [Prevotella sp.]|nr:hypothetical protein [Prevotella sp.]